MVNQIKPLVNRLSTTFKNGFRSLYIFYPFRCGIAMTKASALFSAKVSINVFIQGMIISKPSNPNRFSETHFLAKNSSNFVDLNFQYYKDIKKLERKWKRWDSNPLPRRQCSKTGSGPGGIGIENSSRFRTLPEETGAWIQRLDHSASFLKYTKYCISNMTLVNLKNVLWPYKWVLI